MALVSSLPGAAEKTLVRGPLGRYTLSTLLHAEFLTAWHEDRHRSVHHRAYAHRRSPEPRHLDHKNPAQIVRPIVALTVVALFLAELQRCSGQEKDTYHFPLHAQRLL